MCAGTVTALRLRRELVSHKTDSGQSNMEFSAGSFDLGYSILSIHHNQKRIQNEQIYESKGIHFDAT